MNFTVSPTISREMEMERDEKGIVHHVVRPSHLCQNKRLSNSSGDTVRDISLNEIMDLLIGYYCPKTIEIAERLKFFKRVKVIMNVLQISLQN